MFYERKIFSSCLDTNIYINVNPWVVHIRQRRMLEFKFISKYLRHVDLRNFPTLRWWEKFFSFSLKKKYFNDLVHTAWGIYIRWRSGTWKEKKILRVFVCHNTFHYLNVFHIYITRNEKCISCLFSPPYHHQQNIQASFSVTAILEMI